METARLTGRIRLTPIATVTTPRRPHRRRSSNPQRVSLRLVS